MERIDIYETEFDRAAGESGSAAEINRLPNRIYILDPYDPDGELRDNIEDVLWCEAAIGDENVAYLSAQSVTGAMIALRAAVALEVKEGRPVEYIVKDIEGHFNNAIASLGLPFVDL